MIADRRRFRRGRERIGEIEIALHLGDRRTARGGEQPGRSREEADAAVTAGVVSLRGTSTVGGQPALRAGGAFVVAITMKPRVKLVPEGLDGRGGRR